MYPVDGVVVTAFLSGSDEVAAELCPRGLRRHCFGTEDGRIGRDPGSQTAPLQQGEHAAGPANVVVGQVKLRDPRVGEAELVLDRVAVEQLAA